MLANKNSNFIYTFNRQFAKTLSISGQNLGTNPPNDNSQLLASRPPNSIQNSTTNLQTNRNDIHPRPRPTANPIHPSPNQPRYSFNRVQAKVAAPNVVQNPPNSNKQLELNSNPNSTTTSLQTNSNGIHCQLQPTNLTIPSSYRYSFNRVQAGSIVVQTSRTNPPNNQLPPISLKPTNNGRWWDCDPSPDLNNNISPAKRAAGPNDNLRKTGKRLKTGPQAAKSPYRKVTNKVQTIEIKFYLLNNKEFYIKFKFDQRLKDEVERLNPVRFDANRKIWIFKLENYKDTFDRLAAIKLDQPTIKLGEGFSKEVLDILQDSLRYDTIEVDLEANGYSKSLLKRLFPYQKEGVIFGVKREGRCLIADDMGLGKTMQAIVLALYYFDEWPLLVVCPASVKFQWVDALLNWVPGLKKNDILEIGPKSECAGKNHLVVIASYDSIHKAEQHFSKAVNCAILDECHMIKESSTQRFRNAAKLVGKAKRLILVSGTPAMSRPIELFTQLKLLLPKIFSNKAKYGTRYCDPKDTPWGLRYAGCTRPEELRVILESTVMLRRMKDDIMNKLPPKRRVKIKLDCHISKNERNEIEKFSSGFKDPQEEAKLKANDLLMSLFAKTAEIKLKPVLNHLEAVLEKNEKFILFAFHRVMINGVCEYLAKKKIAFIKIDGSTLAKDREEGCKLFQENENYRAAVLSITAAGVGLTLTAAQLVIFAELYFNPGTLIQAEDRVHRIGQKNSVHIEYLICPKTIDKLIWSMVQAKLETLDSLGIQSDGFQAKFESLNTSSPPAGSSPIAQTSSDLVSFHHFSPLVS